MPKFFLHLTAFAPVTAEDCFEADNLDAAIAMVKRDGAEAFYFRPEDPDCDGSGVSGPVIATLLANEDFGDWKDGDELASITLEEATDFALLRDAEAFVAGFEGDEAQEGIDGPGGLLARLRAAIKGDPMPPGGDAVALLREWAHATYLDDDGARAFADDHAAALYDRTMAALAGIPSDAPSAPSDAPAPADPVKADMLAALKALEASLLLFAGPVPIRRDPDDETRRPNLYKAHTAMLEARRLIARAEGRA